MVQTRVRNVLEPLSADEVRAAVRILKAEKSLPAKHRFIQVALREPDKAHALATLAGANGHAPDREAAIVVLDHDTRSTWEGVVSISAGSVVSWEQIRGVQPPIAMEEFTECEEACKADPAFRDALAKRGVTDMDLVMVDPWSAGHYDDDEGRRLSRALVWVRAEPDDNGYAHPVENLIALVDLHEMTVHRVEDHGVIPIPWADGNYTPKYTGAPRTDLKPIEISQPEGVSFTVDGHEVAWQNWRFRVGFTPREGLVLHTVGWQDGERLRSILYRASLAEMVVPYGDTNITQARKNAFDVGEYNIGLLANSLELGCDCVGEIRYFDAVVCDNRGEPMTIANAICMHEEDASLLWKHSDFRTGASEVRRSRKLVVSFISTVGNYDYGFYWSFFQDGSILYEVKQTGILTTAVTDGSQPLKYGQLLNTDGLYAPIHQHFYGVRLDMDVDGTDNSLYEVHAEQVPAGGDNLFNNAFYSKTTLLKSESEAQQNVDPLTGRIWKVASSSRTNAVGEPTAYRLVPHNNVAAFAAPEASVSKRAGFISKHLWATPWNRAENFPAGDYPNQHAGGAGLPEWTAADRNIENTDVVLWYTLGAHHPPRLEDWPVMPVTGASFMLQPAGFFDRNPTLDVAAPKHHENGHCGT
ncbi:MAG: primary-amine oxidase [Chloroflexota bacterium]|nr:primary-amine oxidase [Chloroflexota bacterium]